jgi:protein SCO1/2
VARLSALAVAAAAIVGVTAGVALHNAFGTRAAQAGPSLPALHGQATWRSGEAPAPLFALRDQHGRVVRLAGYRGRTVVLAFMDSLCTSECPIESRLLAAAIRRLPRRERPQLIVVSVDLADSPRSVAAAARKWGLPKGFEWLLGTHAQLAPVWRAYRIYVKAGKGDIVHSDAFYVVDRRGDERAGFLAPFAPGLLRLDLHRLASAT